MSEVEKDDLLNLIEDDGLSPHQPKRWKVAIIDDDIAVHEGTRYALSDYELNGTGLQLYFARSASEGRELLRSEADIAVILLDVVMESDTAGLELVDFIRTELKNDVVRIILRTGQPGEAPERRVIVDYDINDYKAKTELTADRLFTTVTAAIRSYQQISRISETRRGLEIILDAASSLFDLGSMQRLAEGVLTQLASLLDSDCEGILVVREKLEQNFSVLASSGCYTFSGRDNAEQELEPELLSLIRRAFALRATEYMGQRSVIYLSTPTGTEIVVLLKAEREPSETDRALIGIFCSRLAVAFDNVVLYDQLQRTNEDLDQRVTERTQQLTVANARLRSQWLQARRANAFQREVIGTVAHDIRNPLGIVLGRAEIMKEMVQSGGSDVHLLLAQIDHIRTSAVRLSEMVNDLLSQASSDAMDITLRREKIDLGTLCREVVEANKVIADKKSQQITLQLPEAPVAIFGDPDRLREAVDNLVSNAVKYSMLDGRISISISQAAGMAEVSVTDSGPGLLQDDMRRLFGRFQRLSAKPTGGEPSTGLGLSITKKIIDLHEGELLAQSAGAGTGSTFTMRVPLDRSVTT